jgi:beta-1,4-mannosyl-glycoprotein beta-1,4-N-acetylglucosaminyltransferase
MIYDCFTFFNELDILELRLNELSVVVDRFVIVEATLNHQGKPKPLYFEENKERFSKFLPKITHIIVREYPENPAGDAWVYERHQRSCIILGLKDCKPDDVIMVSDVDEIPRPSKIKEASKSGGIRIFRQHMFYYYMNYMNSTDISGGKRKYSWMGTVMVDFKDITSIQELRDISIKALSYYHANILIRLYWRRWLKRKIAEKGLRLSFIDDGGWHFSYLGGVDRIIKKLESFAHTEYNKPEYKDPKKIEEAIREGRDIFGRDFSYRVIDIDNTFPRYFLENRDKFSKLVV